METNVVEELGLVKLTKDLKKIAQTMDRTQARNLIRSYYNAQDQRTRYSKQIKTSEKLDRPHDVLEFFKGQSEFQEKQVASAIVCWAEQDPMAAWSMQHKGVGPVLAAALSAFIDITRAPTVGHIWAFMGYDPTKKWEKGKERPWCAALKTTGWKLWQSWLKLKNDPGAEWAQRFNQRRAYEWENNLAGRLGGECTRALTSRKIDKKSPTYAWLTGRVDREWATEMVSHGKVFPLNPQLSEGDDLWPMLSPGHIQSRAGRWTVKLFMSQWHAQAYRLHYGTEPPLPYPIAHLGHAHLITTIAKESTTVPE